MTVLVTDIAEIQIGYQGRGRLEYDPAGGVCLLQMRDLEDDGRVRDASRLLRVAAEGESPERYGVRDGDVVFQARGSRNRAFVLRGVPPSTLASNHFYILRMRSDIMLPPFLAWALNQSPAQAHLGGMTQGTTTMLVPKDAFTTLSVAVPPPDVQRAIVQLAALREKEAQTVQNLERKRDILLRALCMRAAGWTEPERSRTWRKK